MDLQRNKLYYGDNLYVLERYIKDDSVDLIYLDPPFNSNADYSVLFKEPTGEVSEAQVTAFEDTWHWTQETEVAFQRIVDRGTVDVVETMAAFRRFIKRNDMMAYLVMMCVRLIELKRVLKDTGSIYLHCDPTASHYLKVIMDAIFGIKNFRNEIVWHYTGWNKRLSKWFEKRSDSILFYCKSDNQQFNSYSTQWASKEEYVKKRKQKLRIDEQGREYVLSDAGEGKRIKRYLEEAMEEGVAIDNVWDIDKLNSSAKERLGYPTQKPIALLERIIMASSNEGDLVLDPFCGCGTTVTAAQKLNRQWIGIDITHLATNLIKLRLADMFELEPKRDYDVTGEPEDFTGATELALQNRYQFQWWATSLINARPYGDKKRGKDTGIDGILYFSDEKDKVKKAIVSVKSGKVSVSNVRDLGHVIDRERSDIGILITLTSPTRDMTSEAAAKGLYKSEAFFRDYARIQILTIEELLNGKKPDVPILVSPFKRAQWSDTTENGLF
ncbi:adenine-specific DNA-methyltransferase [Candidatus Magnetobacterium bavaricum]|uniref:Methyltransferase n=1 Tax=Candidatus Magnetobacterium bavaricum TaxID=29290 RepID=A0A0F3GH78_9BACT|nr:adenine-specific DNA-methyltransferase [Candidatus Magnetobacterium bavaricum]